MSKEITARDLSDIRNAVVEQKEVGAVELVLTLDEVEGLLVLAELGMEAEELASEFEKLLEGRISERPSGQLALDRFYARAKARRGTTRVDEAPGV